MKFFHASKKQFTKPDPSFFKEEKDFGPRFYCADNRESAEEYCDDRNCEWIMEFDFDIDNAHAYGLTVRYFDPDHMTNRDIADWVREIILNRAPDADLVNIDEYDYIPENIIIGPRADDDINDVLMKMINARIDMMDDDVIVEYYESFRPRRYDIQYCFDEDACEVIFYDDYDPIDMVITRR